jgi:hypothetical protein
VTITANFRDKSLTKTLFVPATKVSDITLPSQMFTGSKVNFELDLTHPAEYNGHLVYITGVPGITQVTIPTYQSWVPLTLVWPAVTSEQHITVTASDSTTTVSKTITLDPPRVSGLQFNATSVVGGNSIGATAIMSGTVAVDTALGVKSQSPGLLIPPSSVTVAQGKDRVYFASNTAGVDQPTNVTLTVWRSPATVNATLTLNPAVIQSLTLSPSTVTGGANVTATVRLNGKASFYGRTISITSNNANAVVPASVKIAAQATLASFTIKTTASLQSQSALITVTDGKTTQSATLTINP